MGEMDYTDFWNQPGLRDDYYAGDPRYAAERVSPFFPPPAPGTISPNLRQLEDQARPPTTAAARGGGGFWGGLLDIVRNVPITIGSQRQGKITLPSYNEMTSGRRLLDFGKAQGLDMGPYADATSVSPQEASFAVQQGLTRRQQAPLGMDVALQIMPMQPGEPPAAASSRAMLARMPVSGLPTILGHQITAYGGLPGMGPPDLDIEQFLKQYRSEKEPPVAPPAAPGQQPSPSAVLPQPRTMPPLTGQEVGRLKNGRPIIRTADGGVSTHRTITEVIDGKWYNIPTMFGGKEVPPDQAIALVRQAGWKDPDTGETLTPYATQQEAEAADRVMHAGLNRELQQMGVTSGPAPTPAPTPARPATAPAAQPPSVAPAPAAVSAVRPAPTPAPPPTPTTAPVAQMTTPGGAQLPPLPTQPQKPGEEITREQILAHPTVQAALQASGSRVERQRALRTALAGVEGKIRQERYQRHQDELKDYDARLRAFAEARRALYPDWGLSPDLRDQVMMDYWDQIPLGGHPSQAMIQASTPRMEARVAERKARESTAVDTAKWGFKLTLPLSETQKERGTHFLDTGSGEALNQAVSLGDALARERQGTAKQVSDEEYVMMQRMQNASDVVREGVRLTEQVYNIIDGYLGQMTPAERADPMKWIEGHWAQVVQDHPEVIQAQKYWRGTLQTLARGIGDAKGDLSQQELAAAESIIPQMGYVLRGIGIRGGPSGFSVNLPSQLIPDTREVALRTIDNMKNLLNQRARRILRNPQFQFEGLVPRTEAEHMKEREEQQRQRVSTPAAPPQPGVLEKAVGTLTGTTPAPGMAQRAYESLTGIRKKTPAPAPGQPAPPSAAPTAPQAGTGAPLQQAHATALRILGISKVPDPKQDAPGFQQYLQTAHQQIARYRRDLTPAQLNELMQIIAQNYGGTWQSPQQ